MFWKLLSLFLIGLIVQWIFSVIIMFDFNKKTYQHRPGVCRRVEGVENGSEDIALVEEKQIAFITSGIVYLPKPDAQITWEGKIFLYDLKSRDFKVKPLKLVGLEAPDEFHPHGISHFILKNGTIRLFIVTHSKTFKHAIVILDYDEKTQQLRHVRTIRDEKFVRPNDVAATGENTFLVGNDGGAQTSLTNAIEAFTGFYGGSVVYYDGQKTHYLLEKTVANGISLSRDRKILFVSHINQENIGVYNFDEKNLKLSEISQIPTFSGCDNFYIDTKNQLWTGCHPIMHEAVGHLGNPTDPSLKAPSQVLRVKFSPDLKTAQLTEVLADDGSFVSASAIAVPFDNNKQLLVGTVSRELVHCDIVVPLDF